MFCMLNLIAPWEVPGALTLVDELVDGCYAALGRWIGNGAVLYVHAQDDQRHASYHMNIDNDV